MSFQDFDGSGTHFITHIGSRQAALEGHYLTNGMTRTAQRPSSESNCGRPSFKGQQPVAYIGDGLGTWRKRHALRAPRQMEADVDETLPSVTDAVIDQRPAS